MNRTAVGMQAVARTAGPSGPLGGDDGVLLLTGDGLSERLRALFAFVDGDASAVEFVRARLRSAFAPGGEIDNSVPGTEELFLASVLHRLDGDVAEVPIVLAARRDHDLLVRARGGACVYAEARVVGDALRRLPEEGQEGHAVPPLPVAPGDFLVLAGAEVARFVGEEEVAQALHDCPTVGDAADSIVALAARRGGRIARGAVIRLGESPAPKGTGREPEDNPPAGPSALRRLWSRSRLIPLAILLALLVVAGAALYSRMHGGSRTENPQPNARPAPAPGPVAPGGLVAVQDTPWRMRLRWQPAPRAVEYTVGVGRHRYHTTATSVALAGVLRPGRNYRWWVRAGFPGGRTMTSLRTPLRLLAQPNAYWRFPALKHASSLAVLSLVNGGKRPATVTVRGMSGAHSVLGTPVVDPGGHLDLRIGALSGSSSGDGFDVMATAPIIAVRLTKTGSATATDYGFPQQFIPATGGPPASPATTATPVSRAGTLTATVRVHSAPGVSAPIVGVALAGTHIQVLGSRGGWVQVRVPNGPTGYVLGTYVR